MTENAKAQILRLVKASRAFLTARMTVEVKWQKKLGVEMKENANLYHGVTLVEARINSAIEKMERSVGRMTSWSKMITAFTKSKDAVSSIAYLLDFMIRLTSIWAYNDLLHSSISFQDVIIASLLLLLTENPAQEILNAWGPMTRAFHAQAVRLDNKPNRAIP